MTETEGRTLPVTDLSLVVLIGASGSGKSTFARQHFKPTEIISSDFCRGWSATTRTTRAPPGTPSTSCTTSPANAWRPAAEPSSTPPACSRTRAVS